MEPVEPPLPAAPELPPASSLAGRLFNVYATPGEVFDEVRCSPPRAANWLVPILLSCLVGMVSTFVIFSQPTIAHQVQEQQARALEKKLQDLPPDQRAEVRKTIERFGSGTLLKVVAVLGAGAGTFVWLFLVTLVVWLAGRFVFGAPLGYGRTLEVCGLAGMVSLLGTVLSTLLIVGMGTLFATPGPVLLLRGFDPTNKLHLALAACNVMTLWYIATLSIGLARLTGGPVSKALLCLFAPWAMLRFGLIVLGWGQPGL